MQCDRWQDALSAMADGEEPGVDARLVQRHLTTCAPCRSFGDAIDDGRRAVVRRVPDMADLPRRVSRLNAVADRASRWGVLRALLVVVGVEVMVVSVPSLVADAHDARHLGAFTIAYGVALLVVAARPARARTVLPVAAVLAGALAITAVVDLVRGAVPLVNETTHVPELISLVLVWMLAAPTTAPPVAVAVAGDPAGPHLTAVPGDRVPGD
jgi:predicted anti-sigma-YlaC factor YlaD